MNATLAGGAVRKVGIQLILPVLIVVAYQVATVVTPSPFTPGIPQILDAFGRTWLGDGFARNVVPSLSNLAAGYLIGLTLGIAGGVLLGRLRIFSYTFTPVIAFLITIPGVAILPIFLFIFGIGPQMQTAVIAFAATGGMTLNTAAAVRAVEPTLEDVARVYRFGAARRAFQVFLPAALTRILASARVALAIAILVMVVSEMVGAGRGIGAVTLEAQQGFDYATMWSGMLLVSLLGVGLNYLFTLLERVVARATGTAIVGAETD